ncbi:hypothetical protein Tco_1041275 [Tanacetum coccineum]|uniref:Uncharacterized protein n=1 Tax=Tanacetum coccineum TaxID=301880 RepID=A0ABQ5GH66_9ASTR
MERIPSFIITGDDGDQEKTHYSNNLNLGPAYRRNESVTMAIQILTKMKNIATKGGGLEVGSIRRIQGIGYGVLEFLGVGTTFDIFQNIHILYLQYGVLTSSGYGVLIFFPLWSLVSAGTDTPYLP